MKITLFVLLLTLAPMAAGSELRLTSVLQPLYLHGSDTDPTLSITAVPYVTFLADPEWRFSAISAPFIPPTSGPRPAGDVNVVSRYRITVSGTYKEDGQNLRVTIDATKAVQPEGYPFTVEQVIDATVTCVKMMYPPRPLDEGALDIAIRRPRQKEK